MSIVTYTQEVEMTPEFPVQKVLQLACAAQRTNKEYLKEPQSVFDTEGKFLFMKHSNKELVRWALGVNRVATPPEFSPQDLFIEEEDKILAEEIVKYYRRLMFSAVKGDNEFQTEVNSLLNSETMPLGKIGWIACLPSIYSKDKSRNDLSKRLKEVKDEHLDAVDTVLLDKDCEIIECVRSKNFDAWNVNAIIDNVMVSWFSKFQVKVGPAVVRKAKIKEHRHHWLTKKAETRLNYVKVFQ